MSPACRADGTAIVGVDDAWCRAIADRLEQAGKRVVRVSVRQTLNDGLYVDGQRIMRAVRGNAARDRRTRRHRLAARRCTTPRTPPAPRPRRWRSALDRRRSRPGCARFPASRTAWRKSAAAARVLFVNNSKATNADSAAQALACFADIFWIAGGKPKTGGIESLREFFPRIRKAYLIGEAAEEFAATLGGEVPHEIAGTLDKAVAAAARDAEASTRERAGGAAVARLRLVRPVPQFRSPRRCLPRRWCGRCPA